ncbi:alpha/beta hydrolase [Amycolatopsis sp. lyj-23]|uniref:alpha/beta hydrolase n=1 Tax=Amycolatopsis sp. lyj-23 TaxID=2789283 RepID=UPI00397C2E2E
MHSIHSSRHFVFVHGAWHDSTAWKTLRTHLDASTSTVELASSGPDPARLGDLYSDAHLVREHVRRLRTEDPSRSITVVAHSYGGMPVSQGLFPEESERPLADELIFVGAFMLNVGDSLRSVVGESIPDWWQVDKELDIVDPADPGPRFYNDLDQDAAARAIEALQHQRWSSFTLPLTQTAWRVIPSAYVILERDQAIPPFVQEAMSSRAGRVHHLDTSHSPFLSAPDELAKVLLAGV